jgi:hypothetical protein
MTRMSSVASAVLGVLGVLIGASPAVAQVDSARIAELLRKGQKVVIVDEDGRELKGRVDSLSTTGLGLATRDGRLDLSLDRIVKIDHPHDGLGNGALIGAGISVGFSLFSLAVTSNSCGSNVRCEPIPVGIWLWAIGSSAAGGAGIGVAIDAMIKRDPAIYRRGAGVRMTLSPAVGRGVRGAVASVSW